MNSESGLEGTGTGITASRWRVLPVGALATAQRNLVDALIWGLIGLASLLGLAILSGLLAEALLPGSASGTTIDLVARASAGGVMSLGAIGLLLLGLVTALSGPLMARALAAEVRRGTPPTDVPIPEQWETAREDSTGLYRIIAIVMLVFLGFFYLIGLFVILGDPDPASMAVLGGGALVLGAIVAGLFVTGRLFPQWQDRSASGLHEQWTDSHRMIAAGRELTEQDITRARVAGVGEDISTRHERLNALGGRLPGAAARRLGEGAVMVLGGASGIGLLSLELMFAIAYPEREHWSGGQAGERAQLGPEGERLVDLVMLALGISAAVALLAFALVAVCAIVVRRLEHRVLRGALADPSAVPPPYPLLSSFMQRAPLPVMKVLFALAGAALGLGFALWFVDLVADLPDWDTYAAAGPQLRAAGPLGPWVMLGTLAVITLGTILASVLDARDRALRDELVQRWPVLPPAEDSGDEGSDDEDSAAEDSATQ